uniref:Uncharacterized protein n=1 Tax=Anopheles culicifacies TaxID=139723 RepID=A0A182MKU0_9DIPT
MDRDAGSRKKASPSPSPPSPSTQLPGPSGQSVLARITRSQAAKAKPGPIKGAPAVSLRPLGVSALEGLLPSEDDDSDWDEEHDSYERLIEDYDLLAKELEQKEETWNKLEQDYITSNKRLWERVAELESKLSKAATPSAAKEASTQTDPEFAVDAVTVTEPVAETVAPEATAPAPAVE